MSPLIRLQILETETYSYETTGILSFFRKQKKRVEYRIELEPAMTESEIMQFTERLPKRMIPDDIRELLAYSRGFRLGSYYPCEVRFTGSHWRILGELFPYCIDIADDGSGNFWLVDVRRDGSWGEVFFACHDPGVIVKQSETLAQFLDQLDAYCKNENGGTAIHSVLECFDSQDNLESRNIGLLNKELALAGEDDVLRQFAEQFPDRCLFIDMRNKAVGSAFPIDYVKINGKSGRFDFTKIERHETAAIWAYNI